MFFRGDVFPRMTLARAVYLAFQGGLIGFKLMKPVLYLILSPGKGSAQDSRLTGNSPWIYGSRLAPWRCHEIQREIFHRYRRNMIGRRSGRAAKGTKGQKGRVESGKFISCSAMACQKSWRDALAIRQHGIS
jgi:hypothetical protein